jgi:DNA/RNA-binding domain of Phe-tRNA-synthetase-like protein
MLTVADTCKTAHPGALIGVLTMKAASNPETHAGLESRKRETEAALRSRFTDKKELKAHPVIAAYTDYYKRFKKTYHVYHQLESVIFKEKSVPRVAALVEAMFMSELDNMLLTAGHDFDALRGRLTYDIARGDEQYVRINGEARMTKAGDMMVSDREAVIGTVIYGPDKRTRIVSATTNALFIVYAVPGIGEERVRRHLKTLEDNVKLVAPAAVAELSEVYGGDL